SRRGSTVSCRARVSTNEPPPGATGWSTLGAIGRSEGAADHWRYNHFSSLTNDSAHCSHSRQYHASRKGATACQRTNQIRAHNPIGGDRGFAEHCIESFPSTEPVGRLVDGAAGDA